MAPREKLAATSRLVAGVSLPGILEATLANRANDKRGFRPLFHGGERQNPGGNDSPILPNSVKYPTDIPQLVQR